MKLLVFFGMNEKQFAHNLPKKVSGRQFGAKSLKIFQKSIVCFFGFVGMEGVYASWCNTRSTNMNLNIFDRTI